MLTIRAMSDGKGYSSNHLEHSDYYSENEHVIGCWHGRGAELLGLSGEVNSADFESVRQACHPDTGEFLRQRQSADRTSLDGKTQSRGRNLYDFTISAPKSVSIMATLGGDKRLLQAHQKAVDDALKELETHAATRVRLGGSQSDRTTGNLVIAVYHHDTSRELDPQLHTHAVASNLTYDGQEGRWKALQASGIYERRAYLTEVYRNSLACRMRQLGYEIENRRGGKGLDCGFEIRGVPEALINKYSRRSKQRDEAINRFIAATGRNPTDNEVAVLVRETRADKLISISSDELRAQQRNRLEPEEKRLLAELRPTVGRDITAEKSPYPSLFYAQEHIFERVSVCRDHEILTEALRHGRGQISHDALKAGLSLQESSGRILRDGTEIATAESLKREREIIDFINRGIGGFDRLGGAGECRISDRLNLEQKHVVQFVLNSQDLAVNISGAAGTGKTATLQELHRSLIAADQKILAAAPTVSAVEELQKVGFTNAITIERLLQDRQVQDGLQGKILILDEAGMVSGRQMLEVLHLAEEQSARIVFSGDTKQIRSVEACDALRILEKESRLKTTALNQVKRQTVADYREAMQQLRNNPARGFEKLDEMGAVREISFMDRPQAIAKTYVNPKIGRQSSLVVCATHEEINRITEAIRSARKQAGELGECVHFSRDVSLNWTTAQKSEMQNYRPGQLLGFHRAVKGIAKNETFEVMQVNKNDLTIRGEARQLQTISAKHAKSFDVLERQSIEIAAADKLLLTANYRKRGFRCTNGEIITVSRLDAGGRIHLEDGRILPRNFRHFTHGYAVTAHRSQGKTVDSVIIAADGMQKELFYVAASRGRKGLQIITSDKELLRESLACSAARRSASELARKTMPKQPRGIHRGLAAARALAMRAAQSISLMLRRQTQQLTLKNEPRMEIDHDHGLSL
ncbi:MAG: relaxase domain-containing protein [Acidobacteria bacterium]|nr:relaxase domain-containing protein [Acidobacteriota bacterium]